MFAKYAQFALEGSTVVQKRVMPLFYVVAVAEQVPGVCFTQRLFELRVPLRTWREHSRTDSPHLCVDQLFEGPALQLLCIVDLPLTIVV